MMNKEIKAVHAKTTCACGSKIYMFMGGDPKKSRKAAGKGILWVDGRPDKVCCPACGQILAEK